jgi:hypothetical protein
LGRDPFTHREIAAAKINHNLDVAALDKIDNAFSENAGRLAV